MPGSTTNLGLVTYLTSDTSELFLDFREDVAGNAHPSPGTGSNMWIIDDAVGDLDGRVTDLEAASPIYFVEATESPASSGTFIATVAAISAYTSGMVIILKPTSTASTVPVTLNINTLGAKNVKKVNSSGAAASLTAKDLSNSRMYFFRYDGSEFIWMSSTSADAINITGTNGNFVKIDANGNLADSTYTNTSFAASTHASTHVGADSIQDATASQKGLMTSAYATKLNGVATGADVTATALAGTSGAMNGATAKVTPVDADILILADSAATWALKKITFSNIKTWLNGVFAQLAAINVFSGGASGTTGGAIEIAKPLSGTGLADDVRFDVVFDTVDKIRFYHTGGSTKGAYIDLTNASDSVGSKLAVSGTSKYKNQWIVSPMTTIPAGATRYLSVGENTFYSSETDARFYNNIPGLVTFISTRIRSPQPGDGTLVVTLETAAAGNLGTITIPAGSIANTFTSSTFTNAIAAGLHRIKVINNSSSTSAILQTITIELTGYID